MRYCRKCTAWAPHPRHHSGQKQHPETKAPQRYLLSMCLHKLESVNAGRFALKTVTDTRRNLCMRPPHDFGCVTWQQAFSAGKTKRNIFKQFQRAVDERENIGYTYTGKLLHCARSLSAECYLTRKDKVQSLGKSSKSGVIVRHNCAEFTDDIKSITHLL